MLNKTLPTSETKSAKVTATIKASNKSKKVDKIVETPSIDGLPEIEKQILNFICFNLQDWRKSDPNYSHVGAVETMNFYKGVVSKTEVGKAINNLEILGFLRTENDFSDILFVNWFNIPKNQVFTKPSKDDLVEEDFDDVDKKVVEVEKNIPKKKVVKKDTKTPTEGKPYGKFGSHGHNVEVDEYKKGDNVEFELKGKKVIGEFLHIHINNHSPKGYAVIKYEGRYIERVPSKISKVEKTQPKPKKSVKNKK